MCFFLPSFLWWRRRAESSIHISSRDRSRGRICFGAFERRYCTCSACCCLCLGCDGQTQSQGQLSTVCDSCSMLHSLLITDQLPMNRTCNSKHTVLLLIN